MINLYKNCTLCPRSCGVDRNAGERGFCGESDVLRAATAVLHRGEEPPIAAQGGSGTIFISGCNLGCVFCQNYQISQRAEGGESLGREITAATFSEICLKLQEKGAENINIVTGSHAVPAIVQGITAAKSAGLKIPALWNSSAYENVETLEMLSDHIDIFLPDLKTLDSEIANKFFNAPDYPAAAAAAIPKMAEMAHNKVIVRHLILPGYLESTRQALRWFAENLKGSSNAASGCKLSLMTQYTPIPNGNQIAPKRYLGEEEYETVLRWLDEFEIEDGFCQELVTGSDWLPDFGRANPFSSELSVPVWPDNNSV